MIVAGNDGTIWNTRHGLFAGVYSIYIMVDDMEQKIIPARAAGPAAGDARNEERSSLQAYKLTSEQAHKLDK